MLLKLKTDCTQNHRTQSHILVCTCVRIRSPMELHPPTHTHTHLHCHCLLLVGVNSPCKAEVTYLDSTVAVDQNIARLEVPMDDACSVQVLNPCEVDAKEMWRMQSVTSKEPHPPYTHHRNQTRHPQAMCLPYVYHTQEDHSLYNLRLTRGNDLAPSTVLPPTTTTEPHNEGTHWPMVSCNLITSCTHR